MAEKMMKETDCVGLCPDVITYTGFAMRGRLMKL